MAAATPAAQAPEQRKPPATAARLGSRLPRRRSTDAPKPPNINKGDTAFMYAATMMVILMTIPGLALFYGGLVRSKNMLSVLMQVFVTFSLIAILWMIYGYSLAFTGGGPFFGGLSKMFLSGVTPESGAATFSKDTYIPELMFVAFQCTFAAITCALIVGAYAERMKFSAVLLFMALWFTFSYLPMAHMVWYWDGPDAIKDAASANGGQGKRPAGSGPKARSTLPAALSCTSTRASPAWWRLTCWASESATDANRWRRIT